MRIDRDRRALHSVAFRRLAKARRAGTFADAIRRPAMLAYLTGMKRAATDASRALQYDVRTRHHDLSAADDRRDDAEIRRLIGWLGLSSAAVDAMRERADRLAGRVSDEIRRVAGRGSDKMSEVHLAVTPAGGNVATLLTPAPDVFGTFGRANVPDSLLDTWAETVAYSQYERGRDDAITKYPAISEALWGYRWSSILDARTTLGCRLLDDWVAPLSDPRMKALSPPRHFNCRAVLVPVWQSSELRPPTPQGAPTDATFFRLLARKEAFTRRLA